MINVKWIYGVAAGIILAILAVYPQINLQKIRGAEFQGAFATCDLDEMAYASYLQALIDGRPRKNDPYTGRDEAAQKPQPESLFSIQFLPPYLIAIPAKAFGLSASQILPVVSAFAAFFTALALFWLIVSITEDEFISFVGTIVVFVGSALIIGIGAINGFYENGIAYPFFPFMRRYIPSLAFPFMFAFFACLWNGLKADTKEKRAIFSVSASLCFAALVFSYFYVWTSAAAVLFGLLLFVLIFRSETWRRDFNFLFITGAACFISLIPYAILLSNRNETMDKAQLLVFTRQPDLLRNVEVIGYIILTATAFILWRKFTKLEERKAYLIAAFSFAPVLVFNQQILTNRSLQPFHYEFYVINYIILLALVLIVSVFWQRFITPIKSLSAGLLSVLAIAAVGWGYIEARDTTVFWDSSNILRDEAMLVNNRLREIARGNIENAKKEVTLNLEPLQADSQPTVAPQAVLWARHQHVFAGLESWEENKIRYYQLLYFSDLDASFLKSSLTGCRDIEACMALFGWDRFNARLSANARPLTMPEIEEEVRNYAEFVRNYSFSDAERSQIKYLIVHNDANNQLQNFDLWFNRDEGEFLGKYTLYRTNLKE